MTAYAGLLIERIDLCNTQTTGLVNWKQDQLKLQQDLKQQ